MFHAALDSKLNKRSANFVPESLKKEVLEIYNVELRKAFLFDVSINHFWQTLVS